MYMIDMLDFCCFSRTKSERKRKENLFSMLERVFNSKVSIVWKLHGDWVKTKASKVDCKKVNPRAAVVARQQKRGKQLLGAVRGKSVRRYRLSWQRRK